MNELTFTTYEELMAWLESRKDDKEKRYYYGDIECMNGELYTIEDIKHDAEPAWFEGYEDEYGDEHKGVCTIYEFEAKAFYISSEECDGSEWNQFYDTFEEAIEDAIYTWNHLTEKEKKDHHVEAIFSKAYIDGQALDSYWPLWKDGKFVDTSKYEGINVNSEGRQAASIISKYMEGRTKEEYYVAYGEGEAGMYTIYGMGKTSEEALRDSIQYGYDMDEDEPYMFIDIISEKAYNYILSVGSNDMEDDVFYWDHDHRYLMMKEEHIEDEVEEYFEI